MTFFPNHALALFVGDAGERFKNYIPIITSKNLNVVDERGDHVANVTPWGDFPVWASGEGE